MIGGGIDEAALGAKLNRVNNRVRETVALALEAGYEAVIDSTPEDTGFLRASWFMQEDGSPSSHPNGPDYERKREHDMGRPFRNLAGKNTPMKATRAHAEAYGGLTKPDPEFIDGYQGEIARAGTFARDRVTRDARGRFTKSVSTISLISYANDAPYAGIVAARTAFDEMARINAKATIDAFIQMAWGHS